MMTTSTRKRTLKLKDAPFRKPWRKMMQNSTFL